MGCSACVLAADLYKQQGRLDRRAALIAVRAFLEKNAELPDEDRAVADAKAVNDAANTILLRARSGDMGLRSSSRLIVSRTPET